MSRISENIRKITKAWGGKTTGNGISDALSDLYNNLPFGEFGERVEVFPQQNIQKQAVQYNHTKAKGHLSMSLTPT